MPVDPVKLAAMLKAVEDDPKAAPVAAEWLADCGLALPEALVLYAGSPPDHLDGLPHGVFVEWVKGMGACVWKDPALAARVERVKDDHDLYQDLYHWTLLRSLLETIEPGTVIVGKPVRIWETSQSPVEKQNGLMRVAARCGPKERQTVLPHLTVRERHYKAAVRKAEAVALRDLKRRTIALFGDVVVGRGPPPVGLLYYSSTLILPETHSDPVERLASFRDEQRREQQEQARLLEQLAQRLNPGDRPIT